MVIAALLGLLAPPASRGARAQSDAPPAPAESTADPAPAPVEPGGGHTELAQDPAAAPPEPAASERPGASPESSFRAFSVPKPRVVGRAPEEKRESPLTSAREPRKPDAPEPEVRLASFWRLSRGGVATSLEIDSEAPVGRVRSSLAWSGRSGLGLERAAAQVTHGRRLVSLGDTYDPLYGSGRGLKWEALPSGESPWSWGIGLLQRYGREGEEAPRTMATVRWSPHGALAAVGSAGLDGSWRVGAEGGFGRFLSSASYGRIEEHGSSDLAATAQYRLTGETFLYSRMVRWHGGWSDGNLIALGARTRWQGLAFWLEAARGRRGGSSPAGGGAFAQESIGVSSPGDRLGWSARLLRTVMPGDRRPSLDLGADLFYRAGSRLQLWLQSNMTEREEDPWDTRLLAGLSYRPSPGTELRATRTVRKAGAAVPWQILIRRRTAAHATFGLFYAPLPVRDGNGHARLGIEWGRSFNLPLGRPGSVRGVVLLGGEPYRERVAVLLDDRRRAYTDGEGAFRFSHVPAGLHTVRLDPDGVPARLGLARSVQTLSVDSGKVAETRLSLTPLGGLRGRVTLQAEEGPAMPGESPPELGRITLTLSPEQSTVTGSDGTFAFENLEAGSYTVRLSTASLPAGHEPRGPVTWTVSVADGSEVTDILFPIARVRRPIRFFQPEAPPNP